MTRVECEEYGRKDTIGGRVEKEKILCPECGTGKKKLW